MKINKFEDNKLLERRIIKPYLPYCDFIKSKFEVKYSFDLEYVKMFEEDDELFVTIKTWDGFRKKNLDALNEYFQNDDYHIYPANGHQLIIDLKNISKDVLNKMNLEMNANKYNL